MSINEELKLFKVTKIESGWKWSNELWTNYYLAMNKSLVEEYLIKKYGKLDSYYYDEQESHIIIEEVAWNLLDDSMVRGHADNYSLYG